MSKTRFFSVVCAVCLMATLSLGATAWAQEKENKDEPLAYISLGEYGIQWKPNVEYTAALLTVSGPDGGDYATTFENGQGAPYFDFRDPDGTIRADGGYSFELTFYPVLDDATQLTLKWVQGAPNRDVYLDQLGAEGKFPEGSMTLSGHFTFNGGEALFEDLSQTKKTFTGDEDNPVETKTVKINKDICHNDDVIIDGSLNVGIDSVCNRSFGFDTIILSENNLRILFEDTSSSASFPTNDWRLIANDSSNGGGNYFAIEDVTGGGSDIFKVEAGARSNALYVEDDGDIGIGTNTPAVDVDIKTGNTPTVRLQQDGTNGFTPQTWDMAGNETNWFLRDVTNGSRLPLRVRPDTPTDSVELTSTELTINEGSNDYNVRMESNGEANMFFLDGGLDKIGIGASVPFSRLDVQASSTSPTGISSGLTVLDEAGTQVAYLLVPSAGNGELRLRSNGTNKVSIKSSGTTWFDGGDVGIGNTAPTHLLDVGVSGAYCDGGNWVDGSSRDFKKDIEPLTEENIQELFETLDQVELVKFLYKHESDDRTPRVGMIAEDMPDVLASEDRKGLELGRHVGFLMAVVKELNAETKRISEEASERISKLEAEIETLKARPSN